MEDTSEMDIADMTIEQCQTEVNRVSKLFDAEQYNLNNFYMDKHLITSLQGNNLAQFLVEKGIIDEDELNEHFFKLMAQRFREHEKDTLPQVRRARLEHQARMDIQSAQLLGPNGEKLF